ncbi:MAG: DNA repair protein RecN [Deltaproteobacteria bacterium]|nr:DNA repair protein RecN [Deltaproteobacteria bacterium]
MDTLGTLACDTWARHDEAAPFEARLTHSALQGRGPDAAILARFGHDRGADPPPRLMLVELHLKNLAIFEDASIVFGEGFNVITGEPGSGKSLVAGSIGLLLGGKGDPDRIRSGSDDAEVAALFAIDPRSARAASLGVEVDEGEVVLRRSLRRTGRAGSAINGALAATSQLAAVADKLLSVVGQHEHQRLLAPEWHQVLLDQSAGLWSARQQLRSAVTSWRERRSELAAVREGAAQREATIARLDRELEEIDRVAPRPGEDEELAREREILRHAGELAEVAARGRDRLYEGDDAAVTVVERVRLDLERVARLDPSLGEVAKLLEPAEIALQEAGRALISYGSRLDPDPDRLEALEGRLGALERLKRSHAGSLASVLERASALRAERARCEDGPERLDALAAEVASAERAARAQARGLSDRRAAHSSVLARAIEQELNTLGMAACRFEIEVTSPSTDAEREPGPAGWDEVRFLIAPNRGEDLKPLDRIASGGELSRVFLALSRHLDPAQERPSLLFDEVDAGIGGAVAEVVGRKLREMSRYTQVLCITHLPQIASLGDRHIRLWKETVGQRTVARAEEVRGEARVREVARMLGGADLTETTLKHAAEMIANGAHASADEPSAAGTPVPAAGAARGSAKRSGGPRRSPS